jgi:hypothetical protein
MSMPQQMGRSMSVQPKKKRMIRGGLAIVVIRQLPQEFFLRIRGISFKKPWHFKNIFKEFEAFLLLCDLMIFKRHGLCF